MKYFEPYLKNSESMQEIDIAVHCDVYIFQWLMRYMKQDPKATIDLKNVLPILISAEFLGIELLVKECIDFVIDNLTNVVRLPIDMSCLNVTLQRRLASIISINQLTNLRDKKDKLKSRIFMRKCENLVFYQPKDNKLGMTEE